MIIFDLGTHTGEDTAAYLAAGYDVVAVEPNPTLVATLNERFKAEIAAGRVHIEDAALGDPLWPRPFYVSANDLWSSTNPEWAARDGMETTLVEVPTITLHDLFDRYGTPHYLKIDIEGADHVVLMQLLADRRRPNLASVEDCRFGPQYLGLLAAAGYTGFKLSDQSVLPPGTSGPFGDDLAGEWMTYAQMKAHYYKTVRDQGRQRLAPEGVWFDLHGRWGGE